LVRVKWMWFQKIWNPDMPDDESAKLNAKFRELIGKIEDQVAATHPVQTVEHPIPEFDWQNRSADDFFENFVKTPMPVVLRGYALQTEAAKTWTFDNILDRVGDVQVNLTGPDSDWMGSLKEVRDPSIYCANADAPFKAAPEMADELSIPKLQPYIRRRNTWNQLFIGQKGTGSGYHCAGIWNFFYQIDGEKKWTFVDPELTWMMYPNVISQAMAFGSLLLFPWKSDLENVYRLYKYCPRYSVVLKPGDVLFNPPWWWHYIDNLTPTSIAVATRWDALKGDNTFYQINRMLSAMAIFNPRFRQFIFNYLVTHVGHGRHVAAQGGGAFDEDVQMDAGNQQARQANTYHGRITAKNRAGEKW
jgi:lysine-specific demethylase 8